MFISVSLKIMFSKEVKFGLNSGDACCHPVRDLLSSCLLSKGLRFKIHVMTTTINWCKTRSSEALWIFHECTG